MRTILRTIAAALLLAAAPALAQVNANTPIKSTGAITAGHCAQFVNGGIVQDSGGSCGAGSSAPGDATFITQTANGSLTAEQALSSLATGLVKNTTTTGVLSIGAAGTDYVAPGGALGTPSSGTLTNATGLPYTGIVSVPANTLLGRNTTGTGAAEALSSPVMRGTTATNPGLSIGLDTDTQNRIFFGLSGVDAARISMGAGGSSARDLFLDRDAAATLRFGSTDAATPVGQVITFQDVVAGTTNTAGASAAVELSRGTGTGIGGDWIIKGAVTGTTGSTQNSLATIGSFSAAGGGIKLPAAVAISALPTCAAGIVGTMRTVNDALTPAFLVAPTAGGSAYSPVICNGSAWVNF